MFLAIYNGAWMQFSRLPLLVRLGVILPVSVPLFQLIPLPPRVWQIGAGQDLRQDILALVEQGDSWQPITMSPIDTLYGAAYGLTLLALLLGLLRLSRSTLTLVVAAQVGLIGLSISVGVIQLASGGAIMRFYEVAHHGALIGFFANKNHMGLVLACGIVLGYELMARRIADSRSLVFLMAISWATIITMIIATNSRAALILGLLATLFVVMRHWPESRIKSLSAAFSVSILASIAAMTVPRIGNLWDRFGEAGGDLRWDIVRQSSPLVDLAWPTGSGVGSFRYLYDTQEKLGWVMGNYVNNVHNDYVEWAIETGFPGLVALLFFVLALFVVLKRASIREAFMQPDSRQGFLAAGLAIVIMFAAHSIVDYPMRRMATATIFAMGLAMIFREVAGPQALALKRE